MHNKDTLESLDYFVENGKALYEYTYKEKPEIETQNGLALKEREYFAQLPRWAQDYFLHNVINNDISERIRWLDHAVSSKCTFGIKATIKKKKSFISSLDYEFRKIEKAGNNQLFLRQQYAKYLADPKTTQSPVENICRDCKSLNTRTPEQEAYTATERYVSGYTTKTERKYLYTDEYGRDIYENVEHQTPHYSTRDVIATRTVYKCSVCKSENFEDSKGRGFARTAGPKSRLIRGIKRLLAVIAVVMLLLFILVNSQ